MLASQFESEKRTYYADFFNQRPSWHTLNDGYLEQDIRMG
jgi:hypothetical protein